MPRHGVCKPGGASALPNFGAAALDEDAEHNDKQHGGDNPDNCCLVHIESPFSKISESWLASP
jgi:hypothetical protein